jgi:hypothetical protein
MLCALHFVKGLQIHPELRTRAEEMREPTGGIPGNRTTPDLELSPAHPLARCDVPVAQAWAVRFLTPRLEGVAEVTLDCTHRILHMLPPSSLVLL